MSIQHENQQFQSQQSNFETIYQRRICELEQKVNKYCAQYDALMNLLPIGNNFTSVLNFQKDITQINSKIDLVDEKVLKLNQREIEIDRNFWDKQFKELENIFKINQKQMFFVKKLQRQEESYDDSLSFEEHLNDKLKIHFEIIQNKLAHYKNSIDFKKHKELTKIGDQVQTTLNKKTDSFFNPIETEFDSIEEEIQITKLKIPSRDIKNFHDFNYHRLLNEILELNQTIEQFFSLCNSEDTKVEKEVINKVIEIERQFESIHYQVQGSKKKFFSSLMTYKVLHHNNPQYGNLDLDKKIKTDFELLENNLMEVESKLNLIRKYVSSH